MRGYEGFFLRLQLPVVGPHPEGNLESFISRHPDGRTEKCTCRWWRNLLIGIDIHTKYRHTHVTRKALKFNSKTNLWTMAKMEVANDQTSWPPHYSITLMEQYTQLGRGFRCTSPMTSLRKRINSSHSRGIQSYLQSFSRINGTGIHYLYLRWFLLITPCKLTVLPSKIHHPKRKGLKESSSNHHFWGANG